LAGIGAKSKTGPLAVSVLKSQSAIVFASTLNGVVMELAKAGA
jgi:hypothetical protein